MNFNILYEANTAFPNARIIWIHTAAQVRPCFFNYGSAPYAPIIRSISVAQREADI